MSRRRGSVSAPVGGGAGGLVPGPRVPLDANTKLAYYCDEAFGSTTLANSVAGNDFPLTLTGNRILGDLGLFTHGTSCIRFPAPGNGPSTFPGTGDRGYNNAVDLTFSTCTLEAIITADLVPGQYGGIIAQVSDAPGNNGVFLAASGYNSLQGGTVIGGSYTVVTITTNLYVPFVHVAAVCNGSTIEIFVNGVSQGSSAVVGGIGNVTKFALGNGVTGQQPFRGLIAEVRLSNVARDVAYCAAATAAAAGL